MRRRWLGVAVLGGLLACAEWAGPRLGGPRLAVVPVFGGTAGTVLLNDLDRLHVVVQTSPAAPGAAAVADTTVTVDSAGNATLRVSVLLVGTAQTYAIQLQGIRSTDGVVLYSGFDTVTVVAGRPTRVDSVPVSYLGPCPLGAKCSIAVGPQNATLTQGGSFLMAVAVRDATGLPVPLVPVRLSNVTPGLVSLAGDLTVTALSGTSCGPARIGAAIPGATDILRLAVSAPVTIPAVLFAGDSAAGLSSGVFCQNTNGTGRFRVSVNGATGDVNPRYSPDRQRVAYTFQPSGPLPQPQQLWVARWAGDTAAFVVGDAVTGAYRPRWSPDGRHLAYECGTGSLNNLCVILDATGPISLLSQALRTVLSNAVPTRPTGSGSFSWDPGNPDRLAMVRDSTTADLKTTSAIYTVTVDGTGLLQVTAAPLDFGRGVLRIHEVDWSPRGDLIVFDGTDTLSQSKLYALNRDGTALRQLTKGADSDARPVVSPDGTEVLFLRRLASGCSLDYWRIRVDGTGEQQVTSEGFCNISTSDLGHDWSPDGTEIVLVGAGPNGQYSGFMVYRLPAGATAATYAASRIPVRGLDPGTFSNDFQPSWRP